jgi:hypothetical protein
MCLGTNQEQKEHWNLIYLGTYQQQKEKWNVIFFGNTSTAEGTLELNMIWEHINSRRNTGT